MYKEIKKNAASNASPHPASLSVKPQHAEDVRFLPLSGINLVVYRPSVLAHQFLCKTDSEN